MGRKDVVSTPRLKKSRPFSTADISGSSEIHPGERPVQSQIKKVNVPLNIGILNPVIKSNKSQKKSG